MRAIVFSAKGVVEVCDDVELPPLGPDEIELRTTCSGVSPGTEMNQLTDGNFSWGFPHIPGYQQAGWVARVGAEVEGWSVGQRAFTHIWGNPPFWKKAPTRRFPRPGSHAEARIGSAKDNIIRLPDAMPDEEAAFLSVSSIGLHCVRRAEVAQGHKVLVLGLGLIGQFACQAVRIEGATVYGLDRVPLRLEKARAISCEAVFDGSQRGFWAAVEHAGPFDVVVDTAGASALVGEVFTPKRLAHRGKVVLVAGRFTVEYPFTAAQWCEAAVLHTGHHTNEEMAEIVHLWEVGRWKIAPFITHRFAVNDAPTAWQMIQAGAGDWIGIVFMWPQ